MKLNTELIPFLIRHMANFVQLFCKVSPLTNLNFRGRPFTRVNLWYDEENSIGFLQHCVSSDILQEVNLYGSWPEEADKILSELVVSRNFRKLRCEQGTRISKSVFQNFLIRYQTCLAHVSSIDGEPAFTIDTARMILQKLDNNIPLMETSCNHVYWNTDDIYGRYSRERFVCKLK
ncbi:hypothetical protein QR680_015491 [Steinernema hermaphroditum]|nr:hypothetical protein QR680_015491 [Steinernema hermaphroditum]